MVDPSWDWQSGKHDGGTFLLAPDQIPISLDVRQRFALLSKDKISISDIHKEFVGHKPIAAPNILIGPVACGSSVLADKKKMSAIIKQNRKVLGAEMEIYGVYSAVRDSGSPRPLVFGLKSVSDFGDGTKNDLFQPFASYFSARVSASFLERFCREIKKQLG